MIANMPIEFLFEWGEVVNYEGKEWRIIEVDPFSLYQYKLGSRDISDLSYDCKSKWVRQDQLQKI